jgi:hypothetical protein
MLDRNRGRACLLPNNNQGKLRQDLVEADAAAVSAARLEPVEEARKGE